MNQGGNCAAIYETRSVTTNNCLMALILGLFLHRNGRLHRDRFLLWQFPVRVLQWLRWWVVGVVGVIRTILCFVYAHAVEMDGEDYQGHDKQDARV
jgi:hypothetical protein